MGSSQFSGLCRTPAARRVPLVIALSPDGFRASAVLLPPTVRTDRPCTSTARPLIATSSLIGGADARKHSVGRAPELFRHPRRRPACASVRAEVTVIDRAHWRCRLRLGRATSAATTVSSASPAARNVRYTIVFVARRVVWRVRARSTLGPAHVGVSPRVRALLQGGSFGSALSARATLSRRRRPGEASAALPAGDRRAGVSPSLSPQRTPRIALLSALPRHAQPTTLSEGVAAPRSRLVLVRLSLRERRESLLARGIRRGGARGSDSRWALPPPAAPAVFGESLVLAVLAARRRPLAHGAARCAAVLFLAEWADSPSTRRASYTRCRARDTPVAPGVAPALQASSPRLTGAEGWAREGACTLADATSASPRFRRRPVVCSSVRDSSGEPSASSPALGMDVNVCRCDALSQCTSYKAPRSDIYRRLEEAPRSQACRRGDRHALPFARRGRRGARAGRDSFLDASRCPYSTPSAGFLLRVGDRSCAPWLKPLSRRTAPRRVVNETLRALGADGESARQCSGRGDTALCRDHRHRRERAALRAGRG